jgi:hypothetical protein
MKGKRHESAMNIAIKGNDTRGSHMQQTMNPAGDISHRCAPSFTTNCCNIFQ